jgi:hypothetical protein
MSFIFKNNSKGKHAQKQRFLGHSTPIVGSVNRATVAFIFSFISSVILSILLNEVFCLPLTSVCEKTNTN